MRLSCLPSLVFSSQNVYSNVMKSPYINPFNDFFIRFLFGNEGNEDLCRSFINTVLDDAGFPLISKISIKNPFKLRKHLEPKKA